MKVLPNMDNEIIKRCISGDTRAQKIFFDTYSRKMMGICLRYAANHEDAEDMMQEGWIKAFKNMHLFRFEGSMEGWIKKIMINTSLDWLRKNKKLQNQVEIDDIHENVYSDAATSELLTTKELLKIIQGLPAGYRTVFNLFAIEGYSHKEIADMLSISESTSKSQYSRARMQLQRIIQLESV
jgi:RNA polymerase sigma factor (sigma-70 family)